MVILLLIISVIVIGSKVVYKDDFAVIEGTMTLDANSQENIQLEEWNISAQNVNYPQGFNSSNCCVLSFEGIYSEGIETKGYCYGDLSGSNAVGLSMVLGAYPRCINLMNDYLRLSVGNYATSQKTFYYKIVLMKTN